MMLAQVGNASLAALGAAAAAICSAMAAFAVWRTQRRTALDAVRPLLRLEDWAIEDRAGSAVIRARRITNLGNGPAFNISVYADGAWIPKFTSTPFGPIPSGASRPVCFLRVLDFGGSHEETPDVSLRVRLSYLDALGHSYETNLPLHVQRSEQPVEIVDPGAERLAPGLWLTGTRARRVPWWRMRWASRLRRFSGRAAREWPRILSRISGRP